MKKTLKFILLITICCFITTGCEGNITRGIRHAGFNLATTEFKCSSLIPSRNNTINYSNIKFLGDTFILTEEGIVYEISLAQQYSNKENCKSSNFNKRIVAIMDNSIGKDSDGKFYYLTASGNNTLYSEVTYSDSSYQIYEILLNESDVVKVVTVNQNEGIYYVLKSDGNIYRIIVFRNDSNAPYQLVSKEVVYSRENYGEIIDFNFGAVASVNNYIKTRDNLYRMKRLNADECSKYVDVECRYELQQDADLMKYSDSILAYNGNILITTYGKYFTVSS